MTDGAKSGEAVVLVHIDFPAQFGLSCLGEFRELAISAGARIVATVTGMRQAPESKYFVGSGKADEIRASVLLEKADLVLFNHKLSPSQERNLEKLLQCRVLDRVGLILDIFARRARTHEGKLQVELAQMQHLSTRLIRGWTHLERQRGGIGLRGPGETQLETDRRLIRNRIKTINRHLEKVRHQRDQSRRARRRAVLPTVSLVGYTNTGKSTLFNQLTQARVYTEDQLFATLDPTLRRIEIPNCGGVVLADTVGFIRDLPHDLIEAFRATLEETRDANLLLHVIDAHSEERHEQMKEVDKVLLQIAADQVPQVMVFNKIDLLADFEPRLEYGPDHKPNRVWLSAVSGAGIDLLYQAISEHLFGDPVYRSLCLDPSQGKLRAKLYELGAVLAERIDEQGNWWISIRLSKHEFEKIFPGLPAD